jgi:pimeloyl-ACP methyl ester carboxylesterase
MLSSKRKNHRASGVFCVLITWFAVVPFVALGEGGAPAIPTDACGVIVSHNSVTGTTTEPIADCQNPFRADFTNSNTMSYQFGTTTIGAGDTLEVPQLPHTAELSIADGPSNDLSGTTVYRHQGNDRIQVGGIVPGSSGEVTFHATGTYSVVHDFAAEPVLQVRHHSHWLTGWLLPETAHADEAPVPGVYVTTFTVTMAESVPVVEEMGASNVLFLPGIQGSRLHTAEDVSDGLLGDYEVGDRVWEVNQNDDVRLLRMNADGSSVYDIYASDIIDTITFEPFSFVRWERDDVYTSFIDFMNQLEDQDVINDWYPYAYDWRDNVADVVASGTVKANGRTESLLDTVEALANTSKTGQVTIVAHSNGGLLTKVLLDELEKRGKDELVDTIVLAGVPQTGTPQAIGTVLHGYDQRFAYGLVLRTTVARKILKNFPGVYSLLPSEKHVIDAAEPLVTFDDSAQSQPYRDYYGEAVDTLQEYRDFLIGAESADGERSAAQSLYVPSTANESLLQAATAQHRQMFTDWQAPDHVRVVELVGVGRPTTNSIRYESILDEECQQPQVAVVCIYNTEPRPFLEFSLLGDETVLGRSAGAYGGAKELYYFQLEEISDRQDEEFNHGNFMELNQLQSMVSHLLQSTSTPRQLPDFVSVDLFDFVDEYTIEQIASPVYPAATDGEGNVTGVVREGGEWVVQEEIPGSQYLEFGGVKYLIVPKDIDRTTTLHGYEDGTYTYIIRELRASGTERLDTLYQASTTAGMVAQYSQVDGERDDWAVDWQGDGQVDGTLRWDGTFVAANSATNTATSTETHTPPATETDTSATIDNTTDSQTDSATQGTRVRAPEPQVKGVATEATSYVELIAALEALQDVLDQIEQQHVF